MHGRIVEVQIGLVRVEAMPVISLRHRIPRPVRSFKILKDDPRVRIFFRRFTPDVKFALGRTGEGAPGFLEPGILIGSVINDQLGDNAQSALVCGVEERAKIVERSEVWIDVVIIGDVVAVIAQWGWIKGQEPDGGNAELLKIIELLNQT